MNTLKPTTLIPAKHINNDAVLEVDAHWTKSDTLALICHPNPKAGGTMNNKVVTTLYRFCKEMEWIPCGLIIGAWGVQVVRLSMAMVNI